MYYDSFSAPGTGLPAQALEPFFAAGTPRPYSRGQLIYIQGQSPDYLYCLQSGAVRTSILSDQGEEKLLTVYQAGSIFGEASFFDGMPRVSTATAQTDCLIVPLDRQTVDGLFRRDPALASAMLAYLARTVRLLSGHVDTMSFQKADQRLKHQLLNHPSDTFSVTHEELAAALGVSRVTVSRILGEFSKKGLIRTGYGTITILDREGLMAYDS